MKNELSVVILLKNFVNHLPTQHADIRIRTVPYLDRLVVYSQNTVVSQNVTYFFDKFEDATVRAAT